MIYIWFGKTLWLSFDDCSNKMSAVCWIKCNVSPSYFPSSPVSHFLFCQHQLRELALTMYIHRSIPFSIPPFHHSIPYSIPAIRDTPLTCLILHLTQTVHCRSISPFVSFPISRSYFQSDPAFPYCKRRKAGRSQGTRIVRGVCCHKSKSLGQQKYRSLVQDYQFVSVISYDWSNSRIVLRFLELVGLVTPRVS